ncbi:MAG: hypothetical protein ABR564_00010 [Candidatus Dormibacteria bacterium]
MKLPPVIGGFSVRAEPAAASTLRSGGAGSLLVGGAVFSFRQAGRLNAVLEVGELTARSDVADPSFQLGVANQIGQSLPRAVHVGGRVVYEASAAAQQTVFVWFDDHRMLMLLVHGLSDSRPLLEAVLRTGI